MDTSKGQKEGIYWLTSLTILARTARPSAERAARGMTLSSGPESSESVLLQSEELLREECEWGLLLWPPLPVRTAYKREAC